MANAAIVAIRVRGGNAARMAGLHVRAYSKAVPR